MKKEKFTVEPLETGAYILKGENGNSIHCGGLVDIVSFLCVFYKYPKVYLIEDLVHQNDDILNN